VCERRRGINLEVSIAGGIQAVGGNFGRPSEYLGCVMTGPASPWEFL